MKTDIFIRIIDSRNQKLQEILVGEILVAKKNFDVFVKYRKYSIQKVNKQPQLLFNHSIWNYLIHIKCEEKLETDLENFELTTTQKKNLKNFLS